MKTSHDIEFRITSLRHDKMIYGIEATALNAVCILIFLFSMQYFRGDLQTVINRLDLIVAAGYTLYMGYGNTKRVLEIKRLEKQLKTGDQ